LPTHQSSLCLLRRRRRSSHSYSSGRRPCRAPPPSERRPSYARETEEGTSALLGRGFLQGSCECLVPSYVFASVSRFPPAVLLSTSLISLLKKLPFWWLAKALLDSILSPSQSQPSPGGFKAGVNQFKARKIVYRDVLDQARNFVSIAALRSLLRFLARRSQFRTSRSLVSRRCSTKAVVLTPFTSLLKLVSRAGSEKDDSLPERRANMRTVPSTRCIFIPVQLCKHGQRLAFGLTFFLGSHWY
jgi:hypothetical protein